MTKLEQEEFRPHLNTKFRVLKPESETEIELIEVSEVKKTRGQEMFWLVFRGPLQQFVPQGCYEMRHDKMGEFSLFIVPIRDDSQGFYYEAVFNRLIGQP
jgi:uncharacterized protein DUF6916